MSEAGARTGVRAATWAVSIASAFAAVAVFLATGTAVAPGSLAIVGALVLPPAGLHLVYTRLRPDPFVGPVADGIAVPLWAGAVSGLTALAALRIRAPLVDTSLARADAALGVDAPTLVAWVALHPPVGAVLDVAYVTTVPMVFAIAVLLGCAGREAAMWRLCFAFTGASMTCTLVSAVIPAAGSFSRFEMPAGILALLPNGAGLYHLRVFDAYRSGALEVADISHLDGVVSFPSFHAAIALMVAHAVHGLPRLLRPPVRVWSASVLFSTIPIGGHYLVDVQAGGVVWALVQACPALLLRVASLPRTFGAVRARARGPGGALRGAGEAG